MSGEWVCIYCGAPKEPPPELSQCCGEIHDAVWAEDEEQENTDER